MLFVSLTKIHASEKDKYFASQCYKRVEYITTDLYKNIKFNNQYSYYPLEKGSNPEYFLITIIVEIIMPWGEKKKKEILCELDQLGDVMSSSSIVLK